MDDPLTLEQLIKVVLEGGATLGMLLLFGFVILKLPGLMQDAIAKAIAPAVESTRNLGEQISRMHQELERLSTLILLQQQSAKGGGSHHNSSAINTELQERLFALHSRHRPPSNDNDDEAPQQQQQHQPDNEVEAA